MRIAIFIGLFFLLVGCAPQPTLSSQAVQPKPCIDAKKLNQYSYDQLGIVAKALQEDQKNIDTFKSFVALMKSSVDEYAQMIKSSSYIASFVGYLPVPYAGEVSSATKLISKTVLNLGGVASALNQYKKSSSLFLEKYEKLDRNRLDSAELSALATYADTKVQADANTLQDSLKEVGEATTMMEATANSIANALETTNDYFVQAKNFVGLNKGSDKTTVLKNRNTLHTQLLILNQRIGVLKRSSEKDRLHIAKARTYSELALSLER